MQPSKPLSELELLFEEIRDIQKIIIQASNVISATNDAELKQSYIADIKPFIEDHRRLAEELKQKLEAEFKVERINNVYNLQYRRFYKNLIKK